MGDSKVEDATDSKWAELHHIFHRKSEKFAPPNFPAGDGVLERLTKDFRVLVVGSGGLGCEILKNLALSGFQDITVIDMDTIDLSNLNRQFLFREKDIRSYKSTVAAKFVMERCPGCKITAYTKPLQQFDASFYKKFNCVIAGLDNVEARRWLNSMLYSLIKFDKNGGFDPSSLVPLIDGGTEGFKGQARLFLPPITSCFECSVATIPPKKGFQSCTIANVPRLPEHCIAYVKKKMWPALEVFNSKSDYKLKQDANGKYMEVSNPIKLDKDSVEHMSWICDRAIERAKHYKIEGVTYELTMQVVKNIIPAIASTNAIISAACVNEALKLLTFCSQNLFNYWMYMGQQSIYSSTFNYQKLSNCIVCSSTPVEYSISRELTVAELITKLKTDESLRLKNPTLKGEKTLWMANKMFREEFEPNLPKPVADFVKDEEVITVTDRTLSDVVINLKIKFF